MDEVFVFGSNLAGIHGAGSARTAYKKYGAVWGDGFGRQGQAFAIPTKDANLRSLSLPQIQCYIENFLDYARLHAKTTFRVVRIGCGLAGYHDSQIAPMFRGAPRNCLFDYRWQDYLEV